MWTKECSRSELWTKLKRGAEKIAKTASNQQQLSWPLDRRVFRCRFSSSSSLFFLCSWFIVCLSSSFSFRILSIIPADAWSCPEGLSVLSAFCTKLSSVIGAVWRTAPVTCSSANCTCLHREDMTDIYHCSLNNKLHLLCNMCVVTIVSLSLLYGLHVYIFKFYMCNILRYCVDIWLQHCHTYTNKCHSMPVFWIYNKFIYYLLN